jgi:phosphopantothenoylcysteine decarboxylase/phosphopantothenate--cysteine ligase
MGYAVARAARRRGAEVTLVSGPVSLSPPSGVELVSVTSAQDMADAVLSRAEQMDVIVKSAAVADFKPDNCASLKIKKGSGGLRLDLVKNIDILASLGQKKKKGQLLIGFAAESHNHLDEGLRKLTQKNLDMIVVNDILGAQTGFDVETNQVTLITPSQHQQLPLLSKTETAHRIWDAVVALDKGL